MSPAHPIRLNGGSTVVRAAPTEEFWRTFEAGRPRLLLVCLEGTLTPPQLEAVAPPPPTRALEALRKIARNGVAEVVIVSGRPVAEVSSLIEGLDVEILGSHGWERLTLHGGLERRPLREEQERGLEQVARLAVESDLGAIAFQRHASIALHTRALEDGLDEAADEEAVRTLRRICRKAHLATHRFPGGIEIRAIGMDHGTAAAEVVQRLGDRGMAVYLGGDPQDEDAFHAVGRHGTGIVVTRLARPTRASFRLSPADLVPFLERVARLEP